MNIPDKNNVEVYINGKCKNFKFIGSFHSDSGLNGVENINLLFPSITDDIESWNEIKEDLTPADLINHLSLMDGLSEESFLKYYCLAFYTNYLTAKEEIERLYLIIKDGINGHNLDNILYVSHGNSINFNCDFKWGDFDMWARLDNNYIVLFEAMVEESNSLYVIEDVYDEVIDLLDIIMNKLMAT